MEDKFNRPLMHRLRNTGRDGANPTRYCPSNDIIQNVRENIENILNSRLPVFGNYFLAEETDALNGSALNFGIVDFNSITVDDQAMESRFCKSVERAIEQFEPRISEVSVKLVKSVQDRIISLEIIGALGIQPFENIRIETGLDPDNRKFTIEG